MNVVKLMKVLKARTTYRDGVKQAAQAFLVSALCGVMVVPPAAMAEEPVGRGGIPTETHKAKLTQQEQVLHALNRFTFGPRPGDEAAVRQMGLDKWFELQLHPERIDDSALEARLALFPAMHLTQAQLLARFPGPQMLRQRERQFTLPPRDPAERAIYADAEATYADRLKKLEAGQAVGPNGQVGAAGQAASMKDPAAAGMEALEETGQPVQKELMSDGTVANKNASATGSSNGAGASGASDSMNSAGSGDMAADAKGGKGKGKRRAEPMDSADVDGVLAGTPDQRYQSLIAMKPQEMMAFNAGLRPYQRLTFAQGMAPAQAEVVAAILQAPVRVVGAETLETRLLRDVYSERQLQAVMTDFWLNHFSVYVRKNQNEPYLLPAYQRETILPNALGSFERLLVATAQSPAMLVYLDNWESIGPDSVAAHRVKQIQAFRPNGKIAKNLPKGINENYARELMELHTLGVGGGYTQQDVIEVAKCFTGWTVDRQGGTDEVIFDPNRHEPGSKTVLGHVIKEDGQKEGLEVLHILATSPATAHFVSNKLAVRFVSDTPPATLVSRMAATFTKTNGNISAVMETMFHSPEFWYPEVYRAKVKTPIEFMVSALRATGADVKNPLPLVQAMDRLGMPIYGMQTPNGYSWMADGWVSSNALIGRMNFALVLSGGRVPGTHVDWPRVLGDSVDQGTVMTAPTPQDEAKLEMLLIGQPAAARTRETVLAQASNPTAQQQAVENFNAKPVQADAEDGSGMNAANGGDMNAERVSLRYKAGKRPGSGDGMAGAGAPETPLATMAGLLLGSPDFQRR
jgi:uncharacterized protein (DUF1800 family)